MNTPVLCSALALSVACTSTSIARVPDDRPSPPPLPASTPPPRPSATPAPAQPVEPATVPTPAAAPATAPASTTPVDQTPPAGASSSCIPWPHPMIAEILYAVPTGDAGDASGDGVRDVSGDEFIELYNPHAKPIQLKGYILSDAAGMAPRGSGGGGTGLRFVFPSCTLAPGASVVVFNGRNCTFKGAVGDAMTSPASGNESFAGALVFSMKLTSQRASLSNAGDSVVVIAPDGAAIHRVSWGKAKAVSPAATLEETAPVSAKSSIVRDTAFPGGSWRVHADRESAPFSPGRISYPAPATSAAPAKPATAPKS